VRLVVVRAVRAKALSGFGRPMTDRQHQSRSPFLRKAITVVSVARSHNHPLGAPRSVILHYSAAINSRIALRSRTNASYSRAFAAASGMRNK
jgi:hypothetical protein